MKKLVLTLIVCSFFAVTSVFGQQWNGANTTTSSISRSGNVEVTGTSKLGNVEVTGKIGIGLTNPNALLHLKASTVPPYALIGGGYSSAYTPVSLRLQTYTYDVNSNYYWDIMSGPVLKFSYFENQQTPVQVLDITTGTMTYYGSKFVIKNGATNELALYNDGRIHAREIEVNLDIIPDYVFAAGYNLMPLAELQKFIDLNHHLPNIKSADEYEAYGRIPLKELNLKLLEKVEELTLYTLEQENEIILLKQQMAAIQEALKAIQD